MKKIIAKNKKISTNFQSNINYKMKVQYLLLLVPYVWGIVFFIIPTMLVVKISFAKSCWSLPPFAPLYEKISSSFYNVLIYLGNYITLLTDSFYFSAMLSSCVLALSATVICLIIGYAMAYAICKTSSKMRLILILMVILPFGTSFLIRVYAWMSLLNTKGLINVCLMKLGLISSPIHFLDNNYAVCLVIVYCYLPFMIVPIYAALDKIEKSLIEAAWDLGASNWQAFWRVTVPLSFPGVMAGCTLVFVPVLGEFVIPDLIGGSRTLTIGQTIWSEFFSNRDWPLACAIAVVLMCSFLFYALLAKIRTDLIKKGS
jgi:putrescine transport system permease protein